VSLKYNVTSPTISMAPGALFPVVKPRIARFVKLAGVVRVNVPVGLMRSRLIPPYGPNAKLKAFAEFV
jgi:hypothetical protein